MILWRRALVVRPQLAAQKPHDGDDQGAPAEAGVEDAKLDEVTEDSVALVPGMTGCTPASRAHIPIIQSLCRQPRCSFAAQLKKSILSTAARDSSEPAPPHANGAP